MKNILWRVWRIFCIVKIHKQHSRKEVSSIEINREIQSFNSRRSRNMLTISPDCSRSGLILECFMVVSNAKRFSKLNHQMLATWISQTKNGYVFESNDNSSNNNKKLSHELNPCDCGRLKKCSLHQIAMQRPRHLLYIEHWTEA